MDSPGIFITSCLSDNLWCPQLTIACTTLAVGWPIASALLHLAIPAATAIVATHAASAAHTACGHLGTHLALHAAIATHTATAATDALIATHVALGAHVTLSHMQKRLSPATGVQQPALHGSYLGPASASRV